MAPNGFAHHGKEEEKPPPPRSNMLGYGIGMTILGLASRPFFSMLTSRTADAERARLYDLVSDTIGILGVIIGLSIVAIGIIRRQHEAG